MKKSYTDFEIKDMLSKIFEERENDVYTTTPKERDMIYEKDMLYADICSALDTIPNNLVETQKDIENNLEKYLDFLNNLQGEENEKFYKQGFTDGVILIINCLHQNN